MIRLTSACLAVLLLAGCVSDQSLYELRALQQNCQAGYSDACLQLPYAQARVDAERSQGDAVAGGVLLAIIGGLAGAAASGAFDDHSRHSSHGHRHFR